MTGHERESRFGLDDPKFWVKKALDMETGEKKIIKLSFLESFETSLGGVKIRCFRNPDKEGEILEIVKHHPHFMQGISCRDEKNNNIRILDVVSGPNLYVYVNSLRMDHESYFHKVLPDILRRLVKAFEAMRFLHTHGYKHGDIRNDHLIMERDSENFVWIDFDYDYEAEENPFGLDLFGIGNILTYVIGKGFHELHNIRYDQSIYGNLMNSLEAEDFSILDKWRLLNLRKLYPYIPVSLNDILLHFTQGSEVYYEFTHEIIEDLNRCMRSAFDA